MSRDVSERWPDATRAVVVGDDVDADDVDRGRGLAADGGEDDLSARPLRIEREPMLDVIDGNVVAVGCELPSGTVAVEWRREAFPPGERTEHSTTSIYGSVEDAEQASGGTIVFEEVDHE
jgi:hypothetical protein